MKKIKKLITYVLLLATITSSLSTNSHFITLSDDIQPYHGICENEDI